MDKVRIRKGSIENCVSKGAYESLYKPNGWELIEDTVVEENINKELEEKGITNETQKETYIKAKTNKKKQKFNDNLFKGE